jgi:hypothetical protein
MMAGLLIGFWVFCLLVSLCQRRQRLAPVIILPVVLLPSVAQPELSDEDWLRRELDGLAVGAEEA